MTAADEIVPPAHASGEFSVGGALTVHRLGFGAMRLPGVWERAPDDRAAEEVLREAVRLGVDFIDTAEAYGPHTSERLIPAALRPYPENLVIATKGGLGHDGRPEGRPERLREGCVGSLRRLGLETIDLWQLHRIDPTVPLEEQFGAIRELQDEGKIRLVGVSEVVDTGQRDVTVPADLADALATEDAARQFFEALAYTTARSGCAGSRRRRRVETRSIRISKAVESLRDGRRTH